MNIQRTILFVVVTIAVAGCATKRYPIATPLSGAEADLMSCNTLDLEILKAEQVTHQINETGEFDSKTMLGFLGDFGIGNSMAKSEARSALSARLVTIREAQVRNGCINTAAGGNEEPATGAEMEEPATAEETEEPVTAEKTEEPAGGN